MKDKIDQAFRQWLLTTEGHLLPTEMDLRVQRSVAFAAGFAAGWNAQEQYQADAFKEWQKGFEERARMERRAEEQASSAG